MQLGSYLLAAVLPILLVYSASSELLQGWSPVELGLDLALSLASVLIVSFAFLHLMPRLYGGHSPAWAGDLAFAVFGIGASLIPCFRWIR